MLTCTSMGCCKIDQSRHSLNLEIGEVARVLLERRQKVALSMLMRELRHEVATVPGGNRDRSCILPRLGKIWATCSTIRGDPNPPSNVYAKAYRQCLTTQTLFGPAAAAEKRMPRGCRLLASLSRDRHTIGIGYSRTLITKKIYEMQQHLIA